MSTKTAVMETEEVVTQPQVKTLTNYDAFVNARVWPVELLNKAFYPMFKRDLGSHTRILVNAETIAAYAAPENKNGGGFLMKLRRAQKPCPLWKELEAKGVEILGLYCHVCQKEVPIHSQHILRHMERHLDGNKKFKKTGEFRVAFGFDAPMILEGEAFTENEGPGFID